MSWLLGWKYRKQHTITTASGAGTNYQIKLKVHYGSGIDSGEDVYLNNKCRSDFGDIRFTLNDGDTQLSYWMEEKINNNNATFWVKISDNISNNNVVIYVYYGCDTAFTTSSGIGTFLFFDDFNGTSIDSNKWDINGASISNDVCRLQGDSSNNQKGIKTKSSFNNSIMVKLKTKRSSSGDLDPAIWFYDVSISGSVLNPPDSGSVGVSLYVSENTGSDGVYIDNSKKIDFSSDYTSTDWTILGFSPLPGNLYGRLANEEITGSNSHSYNNQPIAITINSNSNNYFDIDWIFIRKYTYPEPQHGNWGDEEAYYIGYFSGYVYELGNPVSRKIYLHNRDTGELVGSTTSSGNGYYYIETTHSGAHYIVCLDALAEPDFNDLIIGNVYPTTISGQ